MNDVRTIQPIGRVDATVAVPGSKSIANRALICAALADGRSTLSNVPDGDDTTALVTALRRLGLDVVHDRDNRTADTVTVTGRGTDWPAVTLDAELAGTTSRFLTALAALGSVPITIDGGAPLRRRPFAPLHEALRAIGVEVDAHDGHLPATITGPPTGGDASIRGDVSSQFISALMMIGPMLPGGLRLQLTSELVSAPYVDLTAAAMRWFGVERPSFDEATITVPVGRYQAADVTIEPDASSASYPLAIAAVCGGRVTVPGLGLGALQGDARFTDVLARMGCAVTTSATSVTVESGHMLRGIDIDMADISDLVPTVAVVAACAASPTRIRGVGFIRAKESDRLGDLAHELRVLGIDVDATDDGLDVRPSADRLQGGTVATHHDHRLAMAFAVLGCRVGGVEVRDPDVVSKSWPRFWDALDALRP